MSWWRKASATDTGSHNVNGWIKINSIWRKASFQDTLNSGLSSNPWVVDGWLRIKSAWRYTGSGIWNLIFTSLSVPAPLVPYPYLVAVNTEPYNPMLEPNTKLYTTRGYWAEEPTSFNIQIQQKPMGGSWSAITGQTHIQNYGDYLSSDGLDQFPPLASNRYVIPKSRVRQGYSYRTQHEATNAQGLKGTYTTEAIMPRMTHGPIIDTFTVEDETSSGATFSWTFIGNVTVPVDDLNSQTFRILDQENAIVWEEYIVNSEQTLILDLPGVLDIGVDYTAEITVVAQDGWAPIDPFNIAASESPTQDFMRVDFTTGVSLPGPVRNVVATQTSGRPYNDAEITVTWSPPLVDPQAVDYYRVQYAYPNAQGNYSGVTWYTLSDTWPSTSITSSPFPANYGGTFVTHKIWSHNAAGYTLTSVISNEILTSTKAEKPTITNAIKASNTSITAYFDTLYDYGGPKGDGGSVTTYRLYATSDTAQFSKLVTTSPNTITGLTANKSYQLTIRATNNEGSVDSDPFTLDLTDRTPFATPGSTVLSLQSGSAGRPGATYRITAPSFTNSPTEYYFSFDRNDAAGNSHANSGWISNDYWDYTFLSETTVSMSAVVYARNIYATGIGVYAPTSVPILKYKPSAPTITTSSTASSWSIGVVFGANTSSVKIEYGSDTNYGTDATLTASGTLTPIGPFASNTTYYYRITPFNSTSPGDPITGSITTQVLLSAPGPATGVSIVNVAGRSYNDGQGLISWTAPTNNGGAAIDYYKVQYAYDYDLSTWYTLSSTWDGTSMHAGPWTDGYTIRAKVFAHNSQGYSVSAISPAPGAYINTKAEAPTLLTATKASSTSISTTFTPSINYGGTKNTGGSEVIYYLRTSSSLGTTSKLITTSPSTITGLTSGYSYTVFIRASNDQGTVDSNSIVVGLINPPSLLSTPVVTPSSGTQGVTEFSTTNGTWDGTPTFTYSWRYRENSTVYPAAPGTNNQSTYTPPSNYIGTTLSNTLRCLVTATNSGGPTTANSNDVSVLAAVSAPVGSVAISPSGTVQARTQITATATFTNSPTAYYVEIRKATGAIPTQLSTLVASSSAGSSGVSSVSYTITDSEASGTPDRFKAFAYASNSGGTSATYESNVVTSTPYVAPVIAPTNASAPYWSLVSGTANTVGATYRLNFGSWNNTPTYYHYEISKNDAGGTVLSTSTNGTYTNTFVDYTFTSTSSSTIGGWVKAGNSAGLTSTSYSGNIGPIVSGVTVTAPSGGTVTLTGNTTPSSVISASTSGWSGSPTLSYETIITTALSPIIPTDLNTVVASGTTSASYTITASDAVSPVNIFRSFARATNSAGTSAYVASTNTITSTTPNIAPHFPPFFPPFFPPHFPPFFPPFFPPHFPPFFPPFFPPYFPSGSIPATPTGLGITYSGGTAYTFAWSASTGATSYQVIPVHATDSSGSGATNKPSRNFTSESAYDSSTDGGTSSTYVSFKVRATNSAGSSAYSDPVLPYR